MSADAFGTEARHEADDEGSGDGDQNGPESEMIAGGGDQGGAEAAEVEEVREEADELQ